MLQVSHLAGFGSRIKDLVEQQVAQGDGTPIGDMTIVGGLAASFDGVTASTTVSRINGEPGYIGKDWGSGVSHTISGYKTWGHSGEGYSTSGAGAGNIVFTLQGSTDNFSSSVVVLHTDTFANANNATARDYTDFLVTDRSTAYRYHRLKVNTAGGGKEMEIVEVEFYEQV
jgi:hypothetical protein